VDLLTVLSGADGLGGARQGESEGVFCLDCCLMNSVEPGLRFSEMLLNLETQNDMHD
jgi:hypothetical protein